ncbi:Putative phage protein [Staphylococcus xylosus]|uniref:BppU family phage baseplate upper protein n=1 Tax=Staphylococcus xylosus TaxID=1288 RepID=UPI0004F7B0AF|nr:BppU family phage baseplate upper protein [Staphylococcus xylosus]CEF19119.1 Putative phage protein [Staphylococcus xylosus]
MTNGIDKKALFKLKSEPYLKPISDLGVGFYNLDENTAILRFQLSNTKGPLLIHENNLTAYAYFESTNGSVSDVIELEIEDGSKGIVTITLDKEFLQASTSTKVKGQVYIGVNNVDGNSEYNEVAVFREFTFEVADALINKISSFTKIEYIRMFDQLKMRIEQKVKDIEEAIANGADYVAEMKSVLQEGVETLNAIVDDGKKDIQQYINQAKQDVNATKTDAVNTMTQTKTDILKAIDDKKIVSSSQLDVKLNGLSWQKYKLTSDDGTYPTTSLANNLDNLRALKPGNYYATNTPIAGASSTAGFATVEWRNDSTIKFITFRPYNSQQIYVMRYYNSWGDWEKVSFDESNLANVQKYKLTNDDGTRKFLPKGSFTDVTSLSPGFYETPTAQNATAQGFPPGIDNEYTVFIDITKGTLGRTQIKVSQISNFKTFFKLIDANGIDRGWKEITNNHTDTGWVPFQLINGATANTAFKGTTDNGFDCAYRIEKRGNVTEKSVRINASKISNLQQIAQMPEGFVKNVQFHYVRVPINQGYGLVGIFPSGAVYVYIESDKRDSWDSTSQSYYFYGEFNWKE